MDTFHPSVDPDCYRHIVSERRKVRRIKHATEKKHFHLRKQNKEFARWSRKREPVPLEVPYQDGWMRFYILTDHVKHGPDAAFYKALLEKINSYTYCANKHFKVKKGKKQRKANYVEIHQNLKAFWEKDFNDPKLGFTTAERKLFRPCLRWNRSWQRLEWRYEFIEPWRFRRVVRPFMVTEMFPVDSEMESRWQLIDNYFERKHLCREQYPSPGWKWYDAYEERAKYVDTVTNKPLREIQALYETETTWEI